MGLISRVSSRTYRYIPKMSLEYATEIAENKRGLLKLQISVAEKRRNVPIEFTKQIIDIYETKVQETNQYCDKIFADRLKEKNYGKISFSVENDDNYIEEIKREAVDLINLT